MDVHSFVDLAWREGVRDQARVAREYISKALAQDGATARFNALYGPIYAAVAQEYDYQNKTTRTDAYHGTSAAAQDTVDRIRAEQEHSQQSREMEPRPSPVAPVTHTPSPLEQRQRYLEERVWVIRGSGRVKVNWVDVTVQDADATASHLMGMLAGINANISFFTEAKTLMVKYHVQRLGDIPEDVAKVLMGTSSTPEITTSTGHPDDGEPIHSLNP